MAESINLTEQTHLDFDRAMVEHAYDRWLRSMTSSLAGIQAKAACAILATNSIGGRVLEVGSGRHLVAAISAKPSHLWDRYSEAMLRKAKARVADLRLKMSRSRGDGCGETGISRQFLRCRNGAICRDRVPNPEARWTSSPGFLRPGAPYPAEPRQRGWRERHFIEQRPSAGGTSARLRTNLHGALRAVAGGRRRNELVERRPTAPRSFSLIRFRKIGSGQPRLIRSISRGCRSVRARPLRDTLIFHNIPFIIMFHTPDTESL